MVAAYESYRTARNAASAAALAVSKTKTRAEYETALAIYEAASVECRKAYALFRSGEA